jgi:hypothetical protein
MKIKRIISFDTIGYNRDCSVRYLEGTAELNDGCGTTVTVYASIRNGKGYGQWTQVRPTVEIFPDEVEFI